MQFHNALADTQGFCFSICNLVVLAGPQYRQLQTSSVTKALNAICV